MRTPQYPSTVACAAAGIDLATLKNWVSRKPHVITLGEEDRKEFSKRRFAFSHRRVLQIALVAELVRMGITPSRAGHFSRAFSETGIGKRPMGRVFPKGGTWLLIKSSPEEATVVPGSAVIDLMSEATSWIFVDLAALDRRVREILAEAMAGKFSSVKQTEGAAA